MTAYLAFAALRDKDDHAVATGQRVDGRVAAPKARGCSSSRSKRSSVDELLRGMIVQSGNDASIALAELIAGSEAAFAEQDERRGCAARAREHAFRQCDGLSQPAALFDAPRDLARLAAALIRDYPDDYSSIRCASTATTTSRSPTATGCCGSIPYVDGMKTGHTDAAGWCLIASAKRGERRLLAVVLGAASDAARAAEAQKLLNYGFQAFDTRAAATRRASPCRALRVWKGEANDVAAGFVADQLRRRCRRARRQARADDDGDRAAGRARGARAQRVGTVQGRARRKAGRRVPAGRAGRRAARRTSLGRAVGYRTACGSVRLHWTGCERDDRLSQRRVPAASRTPRSPVLDRGFIYGDGVYELIPVYAARSRSGCRSTSRACSTASTASASPIRTPMRNGRSIVARSIARQPFDDQGVYFQVTRGVAKRDHTFPQDVHATVFMMSNPLATPSAEQVERGVAVVTAEDNRWRRCDLKTISLVGNVLMRQLAADAGAVETVMFRDGYLTEASASNVLIVNGGTIVAPPKDNLILPGITYGATLGIRARGRNPVRDAPGAEGRSARRRRDVAHVVDEGSAARSRRSTAGRSRGGKPGPLLPQDARALPGAQAGSYAGASALCAARSAHCASRYFRRASCVRRRSRPWWNTRPAPFSALAGRRPRR